MTAWLAVVGIGEGGVEGLSAQGRVLIGQARLVAGGERHLALANALITGERMAWPRPMEAGYRAILARRGEPVVVLASGDPSWFGVGSVLSGMVGPGEMVCVPAPSAFSLACARLGWALAEVRTVSFCGRALAGLIPALQPGTRVLALSADGGTPGQVAALMRERGFGRSRIHILESLGGPGERIRAVHAEEGVPDDIGPLNLLAIEVRADAGARVVPLAPGLADELFESDGQLTKREVRAATLSALAPCAGEVLWDVGAGSGSVGIEWCLRGQGCRAVAIEARADRVARIGRNAAALGAVSLGVVAGEAPGVLAGLELPDAVFIGGGLQHDGVFQACWAALRQGGRLVANAVALDTQAILFGLQAAHGGSLTRIAVERLDQIGTMRAFRPAMAVVQWATTKG